MKLITSQDRRRPFSALLIGIVFPIGLLAAVTSAVGKGFSSFISGSDNADSVYAYDPYCGPDGTIWNKAYVSYHYLWFWRTSLFLTITLGFGDLTFAQAKAIDVGFDLVVGRGLQVLFGFLAYPILRLSLLRSLERRGLSFQLTFTLFLNRISIGSLWQLFRSTWTRKRRGLKTSRSGCGFDWRLPMIFVVITYILLTPTILSAATSYQTVQSILVSLPGTEDLVSIADFTTPDLVIQSDPRMSFNSDYFGVSKGDANYNATSGYGLALQSFNDKLIDIPGGNCTVNASMPGIISLSDSAMPPQWALEFEFAEAVQDCSGIAQPFTNSSIRLNDNLWTLEPPALTITGPYPEYARSLARFYTFQNITIDGLYVIQNGTCQPTNRYQWGCSMLMLFTYCVATSIVGIILVVLQLDAWFSSHAARYKVSISQYRDAVDLVHELLRHYPKAGISSIEPGKLDTLVKKDPFRVTLETDGLLPPRTRPAVQKRRGLHKRPGSLEPGELEAKSLGSCSGEGDLTPRPDHESKNLTIP